MTEFLPTKPSWLSEPSPVERLRHCWVTADEHGRVGGFAARVAGDTGLLAGRVVRPVLDMEDGKWRPREEWLRAGNLAPARLVGDRHVPPVTLQTPAAEADSLAE